LFDPVARSANAAMTLSRSLVERASRSRRVTISTSPGSIRSLASSARSVLAPPIFFLEHLGAAGQQAKTDLTRFDRVKNLNMGSFHIHLRGFFSSITAQVAAAVIPPSATSTKTSSGVPIGVILSNYRPLDDLISIPKHKSTNGRPKNAGRCPKKSNLDRPSSKNCSLNRDVDCPSVGTIFCS